MSGFETLPPDQRAVLQLILAQGRGYAELAQLLKIDAGAVRTRAHAGLDALAAVASATPDPGQRAQIADYLLGQQDDGERFVTLLALGESQDAARWAGALRQELTPLARDPLPEVPEPVSFNGAVAAPVPSPVPEPAPVVAAPSPPPPPPPAPPAAAAPAPVAAPALAAAAAPAPAATTPAAPEPPTAPPDAAAPPVPPAPADATPAPAAAAPRPSRLGGAILLAAAVVVAIVLAVVLIGGGDDDPTGSASTVTTSTPTQTTTTGSQATGQVVAQVNLLATPAGGQAIGLGVIERAADGTQAIAIQAQKLPANGAQDIYAAWLSGTPGTKLLGFVPRQVKANGTFTVSAPLPNNAARYDSVLITRESATGGKVPAQPGETIMRGALKLS